MKNFLPLSRKVRDEMERYYPFIHLIQESLLNAIAQSQTSERKQLIHNVLKKTESFISSQVSKLKNKPNRGTKFTAYIHRVVTQLKLSLSLLDEEEEVEAYPTLACILKHYLDIALTSSLNDREIPKMSACRLYGFLKSAFEKEVEYALDVILCSKSAENAELNKKHIGFHLLLEVLGDHFLYSQDKSAFAKYLAIVSIVNEISLGENMHLNSSLAVLKSQKKFIPKDLQELLEAKYGMAKRKNLTWDEVILLVKPRKIAAISSIERLILVSSKRKNAKALVSAAGSESNSSEQSSSQESSSMFYFDVKGLYPDPPDSSSQQSLRLTEGETDDLDLDKEFDSEDDDANDEGESSVLLPPFPLENENGESGSDKDDDENAYSDNDNASSNSSMHDTESLLDVGNNEIAKTAQFGQYSSPFEDLSSGKKLSSKSKRAAKPIPDDDFDSDSDIQVLFEDTRNSTTTDHTNKSSESSEDERDLADPESGEDDVPEYTSEDFGGCAELETDEQEQTKNNALDDESFEKDSTFASQSIDTSSSKAHSLSVETKSTPKRSSLNKSKDDSKAMCDENQEEASLPAYTRNANKAKSSTAAAAQLSPSKRRKRGSDVLQCAEVDTTTSGSSAKIGKEDNANEAISEAIPLPAPSPKITPIKTRARAKPLVNLSPVKNLSGSPQRSQRRSVLRNAPTTSADCNLELKVSNNDTINIKGTLSTSPVKMLEQEIKEAPSKRTRCPSSESIDSTVSNLSQSGRVTRSRKSELPPIAEDIPVPKRGRTTKATKASTAPILSPTKAKGIDAGDTQKQKQEGGGKLASVASPLQRTTRSTRRK